MREALYEKDLTAMKYAILESRRHDRMVREIAADLGISHLLLRRYLMEKLDMLLLENLPARYEQGKKFQEGLPEVERALSAHLYTRAVPLLDEHVMDAIVAATQERIAAGVPFAEAVSSGKAKIRQVILP
jgi:energy-converting hydrogenase A subunit M